MIYSFGEDKKEVDVNAITRAKAQKENPVTPKEIGPKKEEETYVMERA